MTAALLNDTIQWWPQIRVEKWEEATLRELKHEFNLTKEPNHYTLDYLKRKYGAEPTRVLEAEGNSLTQLGRTRVCDLLLGNGTTHTLGATYGGTGVGDSSTANGSPNTNTALLASTNRLYKPLDAAPSDGAAGDGTVGSTPGVITGSTTYQLADANFAWNEWCLTIASATPASSSTFTTAVGSTGIMLNRAVQSLGTKVSTAVWVLQVTLTLT